jgi:ADP-heptose:LPS heptosyltransferase
MTNNDSKILLKNKLFVKGSFFNFGLRVVNFLGFLFVTKRKIPKGYIPKKILVCNIGHLGDAVIVLRFISLLKKLYPNVKIGILISSWSKNLVSLSSQIDWIHSYDHWKRNRSNISKWQKITRFFSTRRRALKEIQNINYDLAIDTYFYFPNSAYFLWTTKIPYSIGYISGGFGNFYRDSYEWENKDKYILTFHEELLIKSGLVNVMKIATGREDHGYQSNTSFELPFSRYIILQIGSGNDLKKWPENKWNELAKLLEGQNFNLIFTGAGNNEDEEINRITWNLKSINLCNKLTFDQLFFLVKNALLVISIDSLINHICALFKTKNLIIFTGLTNFHHWLPDNENADFLINPLSCAPCYKGSCSHLGCIREVTTDQVYRRAMKLIQA